MAGKEKCRRYCQLFQYLPDGFSPVRKRITGKHQGNFRPGSIAPDNGSVGVGYCFFPLTTSRES
jgi:hypothetical protein